MSTQAERIAALEQQVEELCNRICSIEDQRTAEKEAGASPEKAIQPTKQEPREAGLHPSRKPRT